MPDRFSAPQQMGLCIIRCPKGGTGYWLTDRQFYRYLIAGNDRTAFFVDKEEGKE